LCCKNTLKHGIAQTKTGWRNNEFIAFFTDKYQDVNQVGVFNPYKKENIPLSSGIYAHYRKSEFLFSNGSFEITLVHET